MDTAPARTAAVVGAGIGGLAAAIALRRAGIDATVFEQAERLEPLGAGLVVWPNGVAALRRLGFQDGWELPYPSADNGGIRSWRGKVLVRTDSQELVRRLGGPSVVVHRADLQQALLEALGAEHLRLGKRLSGVEQGSQGVEALFADGSRMAADVLVGADGIHSMVRRLLLDDGQPRYAGYTAWRAVTEWAGGQLPAGESWGAGTLFGMLPLADGRVYWFATKRAPAGETDSPAQRRDEILQRFSRWHEPIPALVETTEPGAILRHDVVDRRPRGGWSRGRVTLLGDAAHPMTPHLGQGACQSLEDAVVLGDLLGASASPYAALERYARVRARRTAPIVMASRRIGWLAQLRNPLARALRDAVIAHIPARVQLRQLEAVAAARRPPV